MPAQVMSLKQREKCPIGAGVGEPPFLIVSGLCVILFFHLEELLCSTVFRGE
jgi:hypothetical protein